MCGIVGLIAKYSSGFYGAQEELFQNMLRMDSIRGPDSTGCFGVTADNNVEWAKGDADGYVFAASDVYDKFAKRMTAKYQIAIGHNRKATIGSVKPENAHPFVHDHIVLVHNGTLHNADDLNKDVDVDSMAIAEALAKHDAKAALKLLNGPFALVWYDGQLKTLNVARNQGRPLALMEYNEYWVIASEPQLPYWLTARDNVNPKEIAKDRLYVDFEPLHIYTWNLDDRNKLPKKEAFEEFKFEAKASTAVVPFHQPYTGNDASGPTSQDSGITRGTGTSSAIIVPSFGTGSSTNSIRTNPTFTAGNVIRVKFDDDQPQQNGSTIFLGHPVVDGEFHEDIIIQYACERAKVDEMCSKVLKKALWTGVVESYETYRNTPIVRVHSVRESETYQTRNKTWVSKETMDILFAKGCQKCEKVIDTSDVGQTICTQRKLDGTWRVICKHCIKESLEKAHERQGGTLHAVQ